MSETLNRHPALMERATKVIPGGVNSPVRAFGSVGGTPRFIKRAQGAYLWDVNHKQYIDYVGSWGPAILGHAHPAVIAAVHAAAENGLSFGAPTEGEVNLAEEICRLLPSIEKVRLVSSGTEATMSAIRLARGYTKRDTLIKFEGCYHGHSDSLLVKAGSGLLTFGKPSSAGIPEDLTRHTLVLEYNNIEQLIATFKEIGDTIACVIIEPIAGNMNLVQPSPEFIQTLRRVTEEHGTVLIYDEVMTGFRVGLQGAQGLHGIKPDLTTLGKIIGGGMPLAAFGGRADIMAHIAPEGDVYQAGTLSGNPVAVAAGLTTLKLIQVNHFYDNLSERTQQFTEGLTELAHAANLPFSSVCVGGMFGLYFSNTVPTSFQEVMAIDNTHFNEFFHAMLDEGVYLAPSAYEAGFVSLAHTDAIVHETLMRAKRALSKLKK
jgi:glutamate-1-semialdehyde 2,1-aminomutase